MFAWPNRLYEAALEWLSQEWNKPSRTDQYLIQVATEVRRSCAKKPRTVKFEHLKLKFVTKEGKKAVDSKVADEMAKQVWYQRAGVDATQVRVVKQGEDANLLPNPEGFKVKKG